ncbi:MAG: hypothetical protein CVU69_03710 [Deltaproteobacteria bacterium HGW-Deltaproteobacteria-4]|nr:MAG: hypothetical protein CVU69_03710 [Deltaproteobacteria bacterium HGW-Deltaproteobacteria-4]
MRIKQALMQFFRGHGYLLESDLMQSFQFSTALFSVKVFCADFISLLVSWLRDRGGSLWLPALSFRFQPNKFRGLRPQRRPTSFPCRKEVGKKRHPNRLALYAGSLRPADVWRADKNSLRSDICPPLSPNVHRAPAAAKGGKTNPEIL